MRPVPLIILLTGLALIAFWLALSVGSLSIPATTILRSLAGRDHGLAGHVVLELRLPRATAAFITGALLAQAGTYMQVLLRNPLADPYVLGISGGAAVAALLGLGAGLTGLALSGSAFAGALLAMLLVFGLARGTGRWSSSRLLLTGVVLASGWGALISFLLAIGPDTDLRGMLFWLMGDLSAAHTPWPGLVVLIIGLGIGLVLARSLNLLARGALEASALGVDVVRVQRAVYLVASLLTASAVTLAGSVGFVGLVIPHVLRLLGCRDHRWLLPASALLGGTLLVVADTAARTVLAPRQLPVGVLTAGLGVPLFLYLLQRSYRTGTDTPNG